MSHELRTPMNGVIGMTELLLRSDLSASQRESLDIVHSSASSLLTLLDDVLDLARLRGGALELERVEFDPRELLVQVARTHTVRADNQQTQLTVTVPDQMPAVVAGDPTRLRQVLHNLVSNAVKFTTRGHVGLVLRRDADRFVFEVVDSGIGIAPERQAAIFQEYTQASVSTRREYGGTGLGLPIASRLVRAMGGELELESEPGVGSRFSFALALPVVKMQRSGPRPCLRGHRVALYSRYVAVLDSLADGLRARGARVDTLTEPAALRVIQADFVVLDVHGGGGAALLDDVLGRGWIAADDVLLLVGLGAEEELEAGRRHGVAGWVSRPVDACGLVRVLWELLEPLQAEESVDRSVAESERSRRVLVVDDNPVNARVAELMLGAAGHDVVVVGDGEAALAAVERERWDLVFMDVQMPGLSGFETTERLRRSYAPDVLPVVGLTAMAGPKASEQARSSGMNGLMLKPYSQAQLLGAVEQWGVMAVEAAAHGDGLNVQMLAFLYKAAERSGQPDLVRDLVASYRQRGAQWLAGMHQLHASEPEAVGRLAHTMVGVAGGVGALAVSQQAREVMLAADEGPVASERIEALERAFQSSLVELEHFAAERRRQLSAGN